MYKLSTTFVALVLAACGTEPSSDTTFEMLDTNATAEFAYCFDYNGTEFCFDMPVECFPDGDRLDCFAEPAELPENLDRDVAERVADRLGNIPGVDVDELEPQPTEMPMEMEDGVAERVTDSFDDLDVRGLDISEPTRVVDPNFEDRICEICQADPSSRACDLCAAAQHYSEINDGDSETADSDDEANFKYAGRN